MESMQAFQEIPTSLEIPTLSLPNTHCFLTPDGCVNIPGDKTLPQPTESDAKTLPQPTESQSPWWHQVAEGIPGL